jgi:hypothetical protein
MESGSYSRFELPAWFSGPPALTTLLAELWHHRYPELYEPDDDRPVGAVETACGAALDALWPPDDPQGHRRWLFLGWALGLAAKPTADGWAPEDERPAAVLAAVERWVGGEDAVLDADQLFPWVVTPPQALSEALDVFRNLAQALDPARARDGLLTVLDDCLEGYAVFPGSDGRRDLFNWWLVEAVPAAWCQRLPDRIYTFHMPWPPATG